MSFEITTAFVQQYASQVMMLAQQQKSRLRDKVTVKTDVVGKTTYIDYVGVTQAAPIENRHGDSPLSSTPHARRKIDIIGYDVGDLIDDLDKVKTLIDPQNPYTQAQAAAIGRRLDKAIIDSAFATAYSGETGSTSVTFPAAQQVGVNSWKYGTGTGNAGLTISKLIEAKVLLLGNEVDPDEEQDDLIAVIGSKQVGDLLATLEVGSSDFNTLRPLVEGKVVKFMGWTFVRSEQLPTDTNSYRRCLFYAKSGMGLGIAKDQNVKIAERSDKRFSTYVYSSLFIGASRLEETKVAEVKCLES